MHVLNLDLQTVSNVILGILGRREAALYFMIKKKIPKNAPWGELPGKFLGDDVAPLYVRTMDLLDR